MQDCRNTRYVRRAIKMDRTFKLRVDAQHVFFRNDQRGHIREISGTKDPSVQVPSLLSWGHADDRPLPRVMESIHYYPGRLSHNFKGRTTNQYFVPPNPLLLSSECLNT
ncbi:uncharacterized protein LAESUDRAFT_470994 [Laetiporus sulphureus 93-53]|uniref:Uncharacterized protein n=1 Tax=Laetiporus sulphureus 93-53 TaxID=1314785 RepID=A0A165GAB1_9APHY|nr:uncharacterized protein LAESUDRAFT_470994 [Laetiporus sulphureus 93-53]KZT10063.1 hypothetical protein LAESUDRAFT_470994 [Laetiporus sulphureus 93-53]